VRCRYRVGTGRRRQLVGIRYFQLHGSQGGEPMVQLLMAASLMMTVPCVLLFFLGQRYFVRGVVMSGLKG
jgi:multiple sugar transport system permease protein